MKGLKVGMNTSCTRAFSEEDRQLYLKLSGLSTRGTENGPYLLPEPLIGGLFSFLLGTKLPGYGTNYLKQKMTFTGSGYYGEALTASVSITRLRPEKNLVNLETECFNAEGTKICYGEALVLAKDVQHMLQDI